MTGAAVATRIRRLRPPPAWRHTIAGATIFAAAAAALAQSAIEPSPAALRLTVVAHAHALAAAIKDRIASTELLAGRAEVVRLTAALHSEPRDWERIAELRAIANTALGRGFSLVEFRSTGDEVLAAAVSVPADAVLLFALRHRYPARLLWNDGLVLHVEIPVRHRQRAVGMLYAQHPLPAAVERPPRREAAARSGEFFVCGRLNGQSRCMPEWPRAPPSGAARATPGAADPVGRGLSGETGIAEDAAYRDNRAVFAFAPVNGLGLALILRAEIR